MSIGINLFWNLIVLFHFQMAKSSSSNRKADFTQPTTTVPATRLRGQIGCYACVSWTDWHGDFNNFMPKNELFSNQSELAEVFRDAGMRVPKWTSGCAETNPTARPNFVGASLRVCENSIRKPGVCVKLKGVYKGRWYVYRECWERMWLEARPYHHEYSGKCYADQPVQQFVASSKNKICFCEEDLCNGGNNVVIARLWIIMTILIILLNI